MISLRKLLQLLVGIVLVAGAFPALAGAAVLYDQTDSETGSATVSTDYEPPGDKYDSQVADDFNVPAGQAWTVTQVDVTGFFSVLPPPNFVNVFLYANEGTLPGRELFHESKVAATNNPNYSVPVTGAPALPPGTYWLSVQTAGGTFTMTEVIDWSWVNRKVQSGNPAAFRNPGGGYTPKCTEWAPLHACNESSTSPDVLFKLSGTTAPYVPPVAASTAPSNQIVFGKLRRNKKKGTAKLTVQVPGHGTIALGGKNIAHYGPATTDAGSVTFRIAAKGKAKRRLNSTGRAKVTAKVTFSPTGGTPATRSKAIVLKKIVRDTAQTSVVGGQAAAPGSFPYMAFVGDYISEDEFGSCSGTVVAPNLVLTAGHCAEDAKTEVLREASGFRVVTGNVDWTADERQVSGVSKVIVYPEFEPTGPRDRWGDAALLLIYPPTKSPPIQLATSRVWQDGTEATVAGWGRLEYPQTTLTHELHYGLTQVRSDEYCVANASNYQPPAQLCAISPSLETGACNGDSGGPLLMTPPATTEPVEIGVTSFGYGNCSTAKPNVFTRSDLISTWVAERIKELTPPPPTPKVQPPTIQTPTPCEIATARVHRAQRRLKAARRRLKNRPVSPTTLRHRRKAVHTASAALKNARHLQQLACA